MPGGVDLVRAQAEHEEEELLIKRVEKAKHSHTQKRSPTSSKAIEKKGPLNRTARIDLRKRERERETLGTSRLRELPML